MSALMVQSHKLSLFVLGHLFVLTACEAGQGCAPAAELKAMKCIDPAVISGQWSGGSTSPNAAASGGAPQSVGHVMLGDLPQVTSKNVICTKNSHELVAKLPEASNGTSGATIVIGTATCKISAVALSKADTNDVYSKFSPVHMRLDFDNCSSGPSSGSALLDVAKVADTFLPPSNGTLVSFFKDACSEDTDVPIASLDSKKVEAKEVLQGGNTCSGEVLKSYPFGVNKAACRKICLADLTKYTDFDPEQCGGYAFNAKATSGNVCHLYKGKPVTSLSKPADTSGWSCWNLTTSVIKVAASTPRPPTAAELAAADANLPRLDIVTPDAKSASILTYTSTKCKKPFRVITIQDSSFQTVSAKVKSSEWQTLMDMIPTAAPVSRRLAAIKAAESNAAESNAAKATGDVSSVLADRVVYGPSGAALPMADAPAQGEAAAAAQTAGTKTKPDCKPMPAASSMPTSVILTNIVLGVLVFVCGYGGFKGGQMGAERQVTAASKGGYQPAPAE